MMILTELFVFSFSKDDPTNVFVLTYSLLLVRSNKATAVVTKGGGFRIIEEFWLTYYSTSIELLTLGLTILILVGNQLTGTIPSSAP